MEEKTSPELYRTYGKYKVKICFAPQDVPGAEERLTDSIMEAYKQRVSENFEF